MPACHLRLIALAACLFFLHPVSASVGRAGADDPPAADKPADSRIQAAIRIGTGFLGTRVDKLDMGQGSLVAMAMLKAGVPASSPAIQVVIQRIQGRIVDDKFTPVDAHAHIYEAAVSLMTLANADAKKYKPQIQSITDYILRMQGTAGDWDYLERTTGDTSISQYALLGLWEAVRSGVQVRKTVWDRAAAWHITRQLADGSFAYHPSGNAYEQGTHTMTVAGTGSLHVARLMLYPDARDKEVVEQAGSPSRKPGTRKRYGILEPADADEDEKEKPPEPQPDVDQSRPTVRLAAIDRAIDRGTDWIASRFAISPPGTWKMYYLYGIERTMALANTTTISGHDWYAEGAAHLVETQKNDGAWADQGGAEVATAFSILFLSRATGKMLHRKTRAAPTFGAGLLAGGRGLPDNLQEVQLEQGKVAVRKLAGPVDDLLAELENAQSPNVESAQTALVDQALIGQPEALVGQQARLRKLVRDPRPEVRRTALWALGRTDDLRVAPLLIEALQDDNLDCVVEARNALKYISRQPKDSSLPDQSTAAERAAAAARWTKWYRSIRPYDERDDLPEATGS